MHFKRKEIEKKEHLLEKYTNLAGEYKEKQDLKLKVQKLQESVRRADEELAKKKLHPNEGGEELDIDLNLDTDLKDAELEWSDTDEEVAPWKNK